MFSCQDKKGPTTSVQICMVLHYNTTKVSITHSQRSQKKGRKYPYYKELRTVAKNCDAFDKGVYTVPKELSIPVNEIRTISIHFRFRPTRTNGRQLRFLVFYQSCLTCLVMNTSNIKVSQFCLRPSFLALRSESSTAEQISEISKKYLDSLTFYSHSSSNIT